MKNLTTFNKAAPAKNQCGAVNADEMFRKAGLNCTGPKGHRGLHRYYSTTGYTFSACYTTQESLRAAMLNAMEGVA